MAESWLLEVRARLSSPPPRRLPPSEARPAAVLVPLFVDAGELWTVLTKRTDHLPTHRGQIAFPGGGREIGEDPWAAALRETHEEVGLEPGRVFRLGELDETGPNDAEIAEVFAVPLSAFADPDLVEEREVKIDGAKRNLLIYHVGRHQVWGLTARILENLLERLGMSIARGE